MAFSHQSITIFAEVQIFIIITAIARCHRGLCHVFIHGPTHVAQNRIVIRAYSQGRGIAFVLALHDNIRLATVNTNIIYRIIRAIGIQGVILHLQFIAVTLIGNFFRYGDGIA